MESLVSREHSLFNHNALRNLLLAFASWHMIQVASHISHPISIPLFVVGR